MLPNIPNLVYDRHHHWIWLLRRAWPHGKLLALMSVLALALSAAMWSAVDGQIVLWVAGLFGISGAIEAPWFGYIWLDWRTRRIRLYSDGRMEYAYGILDSNVTNAPMRFGVVRYHYHDRIGKWLDYADLFLPFEAGVIPDIADFETFWNLAQGRG